MKCHYCGTEISENQTFCHYCGTRQAAAPEEKNVLPEAEIDFPLPEPVQEMTREPEPAAAPEMPAPPVQAFQPLYVMDAPAPTAPKIQLPTGRSLVKMIFLGILTLGIYPAVIWSRIVTELNLAASRYDGERTMPYFAMLVLSPITLFIYTLVWMHGLCRRIRAELSRRGFSYRFGPSTFWLWNVLGSLILVGPFVFLHKLMKSMNFINSDFNTNG